MRLLRHLWPLIVTPLLSSCILVTFLPFEEQGISEPRFYPVNNPYDWLWLSVPQPVLDELIAATGDEGHLLVRACYPATSVARLAAVNWEPSTNHITHQWVNAAGCTVWVHVARDGISDGWRPMFTIGAGEMFTVELTSIPDNHPEAITVPVSGRVADGGQLNIWFNFDEEPPQ